MTSKRLIAANWKMNKGLVESQKFAEELKGGIGHFPCNLNGPYSLVTGVEADRKTASRPLPAPGFLRQPAC